MSFFSAVNIVKIVLFFVRGQDLFFSEQVGSHVLFVCLCKGGWSFHAYLVMGEGQSSTSAATECHTTHS